VLWVEALALFAVSHLVGDYVLQTDWQALHKRGGLGSDPTARGALVSHIATYTLAFVPALIWLGIEIGPVGAIGVGAVIVVPHLIQDDGRLLGAYMRGVKGVREPSELLSMSVDQSFHFVALLGAALLAAA
jgi:Protein of unknown function (DUF3307)